MRLILGNPTWNLDTTMIRMQRATKLCEHVVDAHPILHNDVSHCFRFWSPGILITSDIVEMHADGDVQTLRAKAINWLRSCSIAMLPADLCLKISVGSPALQQILFDGHAIRSICLPSTRLTPILIEASYVQDEPGQSQSFLGSIPSHMYGGSSGQHRLLSPADVATACPIELSPRTAGSAASRYPNDIDRAVAWACSQHFSPARAARQQQDSQLHTNGSLPR